MNNVEVTRDDFKAYEEIRQSGVTNMMSPDVQTLAGITRAVHLTIIEQYAELLEKWPHVRNP